MNRKSFTKKRIIGGTVALLAVLLVVVMNPFKITDPASPYFQPENFRFSDYSGDPKDEELRAALKRTFPIGTSKEFVDKIMLENNGAAKKTSSNGQVIYYSYYILLRVQHKFLFDREGRLVNIYPYHGSKLYENQPGIEEVLRTKRDN